MKVRNKIKNINKLSFVISLIISIAAWFYVVYNVNPTMSRNFRNIPVTITGEDILEENGLAVASIDVESIDVTLRAKRSILDSVKDGSIVISADVSEAGKGDNKFALEISSPSGTVITKQSKKNVVINIENLKTKKVDVKTSFSERLSNDEEVEISDIAEKSIEIRGAKSIVNAASYADACIDVSRISDKNKMISVPLTIKNSSGKNLKHLKYKPSKINLKAQKVSKKKVKLNIKVNNSDSQFVERTYTGPSEIYIKGNKNKLMNISSIDTKTIDISDVEQTSDIELSYILPKGVSISNESKDATLHVKCIPLKDKTFAIESESIELKNIGNGLDVTASGKVDVTVYGLGDEISKIDDNDIVLSLDLAGYTVGTYSIKPTVKSIDYARRYEISGDILVKIS